MNTSFIQVFRDGYVECVHNGYIAVVDRAGNLQAGFGDIQYKTYWRSAAKPFQVYPLVKDGGIKAFSLKNQHIAVMCASHTAEPEHIAVVESILKNTGCSRGMLKCGVHPPLYESEAYRLAYMGVPFSAVHNNCSGKHAGFLAQAVLHKYDTETYLAPQHPIQKRIHAVISSFSGVSADDIPIAIDGCSAPTYHLPLYTMAGMFSLLARGADAHLAAIRNAMTAHPFLVGGTDRFDTLFMQVAKGRFVSKIGAEG